MITGGPRSRGRSLSPCFWGRDGTPGGSETTLKLHAKKEGKWVTVTFYVKMPPFSCEKSRQRVRVSVPSEFRRFPWTYKLYVYVCVRVCVCRTHVCVGTCVGTIHVCIRTCVCLRHMCVCTCLTIHVCVCVPHDTRVCVYVTTTLTKTKDKPLNFDVELCSLRRNPPYLPTRVT